MSSRPEATASQRSWNGFREGLTLQAREYPSRAMEPLIAEIERSFAELERQLGDPRLVATGGTPRPRADTSSLSRTRDGGALERLTAQRTGPTRAPAPMRRSVRSRRAAGGGPGELPGSRSSCGSRCWARSRRRQDVIVELRAGTGGDGRHCLPATSDADALRRSRAAKTGVSASPATRAVQEPRSSPGDGAYSVFKYEASPPGAARSRDQSQGRIHTPPPRSPSSRPRMSTSRSTRTICGSTSTARATRRPVRHTTDSAVQHHLSRPASSSRARTSDAASEQGRRC